MQISYETIYLHTRSSYWKTFWKEMEFVPIENKANIQIPCGGFESHIIPDFFLIFISMTFLFYYYFFFLGETNFNEQKKLYRRRHIYSVVFFQTIHFHRYCLTQSTRFLRKYPHLEKVRMNVCQINETNCLEYWNN